MKIVENSGKNKWLSVEETQLVIDGTVLQPSSDKGYRIKGHQGITNLASGYHTPWANVDKVNSYRVIEAEVHIK